MKRSVFLTTVLCAILTVSSLGSLGSGDALAAKWGSNYFPNLPLVTQDGKTVKFYDDLVKDKIVVINFIYASCQDVCPLLTARMARVQKALGERVGRDIFMYSITMDPEHDTPEILKKHAEAFHVGPGWLFLTGKPEDVAKVRYKLGDRSRYLEEHRHDVMLGNGTTGDWMRSSVFQNIDRLVLEIQDMDPVWRAQKKSLPTQQQKNIPVLDIQGQPGQALFVKACSSCHSIGRGDVVGPDLHEVLTRRTREWLYRFLMAPDELRAQQDPIAVELSEKFPGVSMPNLSLSKTDVGDLLSYLAKQSQRLSTSAKREDHSHSHHHH